MHGVIESMLLGFRSCLDDLDYLDDKIVYMDYIFDLFQNILHDLKNLLRGLKLKPVNCNQI